MKRESVFFVFVLISVLLLGFSYISYSETSTGFSPETSRNKGAFFGNERPIEVCTVSHLVSINKNLNGNYKQVCDIDLTGMDFEPIGNGQAFTGTYDGNGYTISNFVFSDPNRNNVGLFGRTGGAEIKNIRLVESDIEGKNFVGGIIGYSRFDTLTNNHVQDSTVKGNYVGGILGYSEGSTVDESHFSGTVRGGERAGGIAGYAILNSLIFDSSSTGLITGDDSIGGIVGYGTDMLIENSFTFDELTLIGEMNVGGIIGYSENNNLNDISADIIITEDETYQQRRSGGIAGYAKQTTIQNAESTGTINYFDVLTQSGGIIGYADNSVVSDSHSSMNIAHSDVIASNLYTTFGGIVGYIEGGTIENSGYTGHIEATGIGNAGIAGYVSLFENDVAISNCYSEADIYGGRGVSGIVGYMNSDSSSPFSLTIDKCYATGTIYGTSNLGGIIGRMDGNTIISDSYSFVDVRYNPEASDSSDYYAGGFIGRGSFVGSTTITNSYSKGFVEQPPVPNVEVGGFFGLRSGSVSFTSLYWDKQSSGQTQACGSENCFTFFRIFGRTTAEMTTVPRPTDTYTDWDFDTIWTQENGNYPQLSWQS